MATDRPRSDKLGDWTADEHAEYATELLQNLQDRSTLGTEYIAAQAALANSHLMLGAWKVNRTW